MKACPYCAEEIQDAAIVCKHCGRDLKSGAVPVVPHKPTPKKSQNTAIGCLSIIAITLGGCWWILTPDNSPEGRQRRENRAAADAGQLICEGAVKGLLRAPASAKFPRFDVRRTGGSGFAVTSYVDAQNGFGANIRNQFVCTFQGSGEELGNYNLTNVALKPE